MDHEQYNLEEEFFDPVKDDFFSSANVLQTAKSIIVGKDKVILDPNKGLLTGYVVRGIQTTGYSTLTVIDPDQGGFWQVRTNGDYGASTFNAASPGQKGQELYVKVDNDSDGAKVITFGTPFRVTGTVTGSTNASAVLHFISNGTTLSEVSRTTALDTN